MKKKTLVCAIAVSFVIAAFALAADSPVKTVNQGTAIKHTTVKAAKMNARGKVVDISEKAITIERTIKGNVEKMEFALENPITGVAVNDSVKIVYSSKEGVLTVSKVLKSGTEKSPVKTK